MLCSGLIGMQSAYLHVICSCPFFLCSLPWEKILPTRKFHVLQAYADASDICIDCIILFFNIPSWSPWFSSQWCSRSFRKWKGGKLHSGIGHLNRGFRFRSVSPWSFIWWSLRLLLLVNPFPHVGQTWALPSLSIAWRCASSSSLVFSLCHVFQCCFRDCLEDSCSVHVHSGHCPRWHCSAFPSLDGTSGWTWLAAAIVLVLSRAQSP